jgi:hypothetical protein
MNYTVTLQDFPEIPSEMKEQAERRFTVTLERALGGPENVRPAYKAWTAAQEADETLLTADEKALAMKWHRAAQRAYQDGFSGLGESPEAHFDVKLAH